VAISLNKSAEIIFDLLATLNFLQKQMLNSW